MLDVGQGKLEMTDLGGILSLTLNPKVKGVVESRPGCVADSGNPVA